MNNKCVSRANIMNVPLDVQMLGSMIHNLRKNNFETLDGSKINCLSTEAKKYMQPHDNAATVEIYRKCNII